MTPFWAAYAVSLGLIFALAAAALEQVFRLAGRARRGVWVAALCAAGGFPMLALLPAGSNANQPVSMEPSNSVVQKPVVMEAPGSVEIAVHGARAHELLQALQTPFTYLWALASTAAILYLLIAFVRSRRALARWPSSTFAGAQVLVSSDVGPGVVGVVNPQVVVPRWALHLGPLQKQMLLEHELEHVRARDPLILFASLLAVAALPWNIALWWIFRRLRLAIEIDCDGRVLRRFRDKRQYGGLLVEVARRASQNVMPMAAFAEARSPLERRIRTMITPRPTRRVLRGGTFAAAGLVLVLTACLAPRPPAPRAAVATEMRGGTYVQAERAPTLHTASPMLAFEGAPDVAGDSALAALRGFGCQNGRGENLVDVLVPEETASRPGRLEVFVRPARADERITVEFRPEGPDGASHARCIGDAPHLAKFYGSAILEGERPQFTITTHSPMTVRVRTPRGRSLASMLAVPTSESYVLSW